jgi:outer membrane protein X
MKKVLMSICLVLSSMSTFAEQGETWVGLNLDLGLNTNNVNFGVGAKGQYEFLNNIRAEASFNYFLKKNYCTMWDVNLNAHYLIHFGQLTVYPIVGVGLMDRTYENTTFVIKGQVISDFGSSLSDRLFGFNAGAGVDYPVRDWMKVYAEVKWQFVMPWLEHDPRPVASVGVAVKL